MLARAQGCDVGLPKPRVDEGKSLMGGKRASDEARPSRDPDEGQNHDPGQANPGVAGQRLLEPASRPDVVRRVLVDREQRKVSEGSPDRAGEGGPLRTGGFWVIMRGVKAGPGGACPTPSSSPRQLSATFEC
jgi:hypothetical protein